MFDLFIDGFQLIANRWSLGAAVLGLVAGIVVGALPGMTATMAIAVLTPFTFFMEATIGIPFLLGTYKGAIYGGSIPAIVLNTPGTAAAAATAIDGNALAQQGQGRRALEMSLVASVIADFLATLVLILVAAPLAAIALRFGPPEFTLLFAFSMTMVAAVSGDSLTKGMISAGLGALLAMIGLDPMSGYQRFTFGLTDLLAGISLVPLLIGMFALSEILIQIEQYSRDRLKIDPGRIRLSLADVRQCLPTILRSTWIGTGLGALPGLGAEISCWISYGVAKRRSKRPGEYGRGSLEGVAAAEAGNNATCPAALIPMLVFGIPGDTITAILLGAFMAQGMLPGPLLFVNHGETLYGLFILLLFTNVMLLIIGFLALRHIARVVMIPQSVLLPSVAAFCFAGAFAVNSSFFDVIIMVAGGIAGYVMRKTEFPIPPLVIALLLAPGLENALRQTLAISGNDPMIFLNRPFAAAMSISLVVLIVVYAVKSLLPFIRTGKPKEKAP